MFGYGFNGSIDLCFGIDVSYPKLNKVFDKFNAPDFLQDKAFHFFNYTK